MGLPAYGPYLYSSFRLFNILDFLIGLLNLKPQATACFFNSNLSANYDGFMLKIYLAYGSSSLKQMTFKI